MSLHEYMTSTALAALDPPFYALIMAAMRKADTDNANRLRMAFPAVWNELQARYHAPLGMIEGDTEDPGLVMRARVDASGLVTTPGDEDES
jgi:hypothetical protein